MLDVTERGQIAAAVERMAGEVGEAGLDGLVNNAGIAVLSPLETIPVEDFRKQIEVNLIAQVAVTQAFLPLIRRTVGQDRLRQLDRRAHGAALGAPYHASKYGDRGGGRLPAPEPEHPVQHHADDPPAATGEDRDGGHRDGDEQHPAAGTGGEQQRLAQGDVVAARNITRSGRSSALSPRARR